MSSFELGGGLELTRGGSALLASRLDVVSARLLSYVLDRLSHVRGAVFYKLDVGGGVASLAQQDWAISIHCESGIGSSARFFWE